MEEGNSECANKRLNSTRRSTNKKSKKHENMERGQGKNEMGEDKISIRGWQAMGRNERKD